MTNFLVTKTKFSNVTSGSEMCGLYVGSVKAGRISNKPLATFL